MHTKSILGTTLLAGSLALASPARAVDVDLELLFLNDVSSSIEGFDYSQQLQGYAAAFRDADVIDRIENGAIGQIAVSIGFFANDLVQSIGWTLVSDAASGEAFASTVEVLARPSVGSLDDLAGALTDAIALFDNNGFTGTREVIDVVTEGADDVNCAFDAPVCVPVQNARDAVLASGIDAINALLLDDRDFFGNDPEDIIDAVAYGQTNIIGGTGSFAVFNEDFTDFPAAIARKIEREIDPPVIPVPASVPLLLTGLGAIGLMARRRKG
jgi:hypothetical protein